MIQIYLKGLNGKVKKRHIRENNLNRFVFGDAFKHYLNEIIRMKYFVYRMSQIALNT
jgi:hypothetical protein